jgi:hypothetical protein
VLGEHREVDGLARVGGELAADRSRLLDQVETRSRRAGEPQQPYAERVPTAVTGLLDQPVRLQRRHQPERRRLVDPELGRDLGDPRRTDPGQHLEDRQRSVDRLHAGRAAVAHHATLERIALLAEDHRAMAVEQDPRLGVPADRA